MCQMSNWSAEKAIANHVPFQVRLSNRWYLYYSSNWTFDYLFLPEALFRQKVFLGMFGN